MEKSGNQPPLYPGLSSSQATRPASGPENSGVRRTRSSGQLSSPASKADPEARYLGRRFSDDTTPRPSPLLVSISHGKPEEKAGRASPASIPLPKRSTEKTETRLKLLPPALSPILHSPVQPLTSLEPPALMLPPAIQIEDIEEGLSVAPHHTERRRSSQASEGVLSTDPSSRPESPDFLKMQSILSGFREKRRFSGTAVTLPRIPGRESGHLSGDITPDKKLMLFLASDFSQRRSSTPAVVTAPPIKRNPTPPDDEEYLQDLPKTGGLADVLAHPQQGIPEEHLLALQQTVRVYDLVMSIRPFPREATEYAPGRLALKRASL